MNPMQRKNKSEQRNMIYGYRSTKKRREKQLIRLYRAGILCLAVLCMFLVFKKLTGNNVQAYKVPRATSGSGLERPDLDVQLLTVNEYSRPGTAMNNINGIVIHYTANPGTTAQNNRDYFEGLKDSALAKVSSHFVIGMEGEVIQCIPSSEVSYASNDRNGDTLSIECCHRDETGVFTDATYSSLVELTAWLCQEFGLDTTNIMRHYDITGKACPKYYVENEAAWNQFLRDVDSLL